jgi:hypothetical protein
MRYYVARLLGGQGSSLRISSGTRRGGMGMRTFGALTAAFLVVATLLPAQPAAAQYAPPPPDPAAPVGGAIVGGALGAIVGGALGGRRGAVAGAIVGGTSGAVVAAEAQPRPGGYYWWRGACYYRYPNGAWSDPLYPSYCGY